VSPSKQVWQLVAKRAMVSLSCWVICTTILHVFDAIETEPYGMGA
jgi:hypothetical protein